MSLSEDQIVRYSRQILLKDVGGRGQAKLLAQSFLAVGEGAAQETALSYLAAGGARVDGAGRAVGADEVGFLLSRADVGQRHADALSRAATDLNPDASAGRPALPHRALLAEGRADFDGEQLRIVLLGEGEGARIVFRAEHGCADCFQRGLGDARDGVPAPLSTTAGALAALIAQRLALGLGDRVGFARLSPEGALLEVAGLTCEVCRR